jgi:hypothetical protein
LNKKGQAKTEEMNNSGIFVPDSPKGTEKQEEDPKEVKEDY